jgi:hypothetical protein
MSCSRVLGEEPCPPFSIIEDKVKILLLKIKANHQKITYNTNEITPDPKDENDKEERQTQNESKTSKNNIQQKNKLKINRNFKNHINRHGEGFHYLLANC